MFRLVHFSDTAYHRTHSQPKEGIPINVTAVVIEIKHYYHEVEGVAVILGVTFQRQIPFHS